MRAWPQGGILFELLGSSLGVLVPVFLFAFVLAAALGLIRRAKGAGTAAEAGRLNEELEARVRERTAELELLAAKFREQVRLMPLGYIEMAKDNSITEWNPGAEAIFGWSRGEALGRNDIELLVPEEERSGIEAVSMALRSRSGGERSVNGNLTRDGRRLVCDWYNTPLTGSDGQVMGWASLVQDITGRVREAAELRAAKEAAEAAFRARGEFLANVSHEIRTPLNAIMGFSELLDRGEPDPRRREYLAAIRDSGRSLLTLINDILDLSRLEAGRLGLEPRPASLRGLARAIRGIFGPEAEGKGLAFEVEVSDSVPPLLLLDEARVRQALLNLVGNAVKFTERGRVRLTADCEPPGEGLGAPGEALIAVLAVEDTGIGIPGENLERIFEAFRQHAPVPGRKSGGSGLGLAIARRLAEAMGGGLSVRSEPGVGSRFELRLPTRAVYGEGAAEEGLVDAGAGLVRAGQLSALARKAVRGAALAAESGAAPLAAAVAGARLEDLCLRAAALGRGAFSKAAAAGLIADLAAEGAAIPELASFAAAARDALDRFDLASLRAAFAVFGRLGQDG